MINVIVFEDNSRLRKTLQLLIESDARFAFIGSYLDCDTIATILDQSDLPDVILMDIDMPGIGGINGVKIAKNILPSVQIVMFTVYEEEAKIFECLKYGASGYLLKKESHLQILNAIVDVFHGGTPFSPEIARKVVGFFKEEKPKSNLQLSERELQLLGLLSQGKSYKEIAAQLYISPETVKSHLKNIYLKMHVVCGTEAVAKALRMKIIC